MPAAGPTLQRANSRSPSRASQSAAVERWAGRALGAVRHEQRVVEIGETVFDLTAPLHGLHGGRDRHLLRLAAMVHDVGRSVDDANPPAEGAAMILADSTLPLSPAERRALAYLTLYHRGEVPATGDDDVLHPDDDHAALLKLLALLRCADALDTRSLDPPQLVFALAGGARRPELRVTCYVLHDSEKVRRVYGRRKKFRLLEELLGCMVSVDVVPAQGLRMVA